MEDITFEGVYEFQINSIQMESLDDIWILEICLISSLILISQLLNFLCFVSFLHVWLEKQKRLRKKIGSEDQKLHKIFENPFCMTPFWKTCLAETVV